LTQLQKSGRGAGEAAPPDDEAGPRGCPYHRIADHAVQKAETGTVAVQGARGKAPSTPVLRIDWVSDLEASLQNSAGKRGP
jgi:hypothetical protein